MIKKTAAALAAVCLMAGLCGCAGGSGGSGMKSIDLKESNFKELGRTYYSDGKIYCALSGTGVEFRFTGKSCSVTVEGDGNSSDAAQADNHARIAIYVNGERKIDDMVDNATEVYDVFKSDADEDVTVRVIKLSESPMSTVAISDISVDGSGVGPTEDSERLIEFVGDSITCGYGVDDEDRNHHFSTKTEDVTKTYAFKTAEALGADWSMVSFSGYGVISGYSDGTKKVSEQTVPQYYEKLGYSWSPNGSFVPANIDWGFGRLPDAVVINLGTNDDSYCKGDPTKSGEYRDEYVNLLKTVHILRRRSPPIPPRPATQRSPVCSLTDSSSPTASPPTGTRLRRPTPRLPRSWRRKSGRRWGGKLEVRWWRVEDRSAAGG